MKAASFWPTRRALFYAVCFAVGAASGYAAITYGIDPPTLVWLFVGYMIGVVCHELGHVVCAAIGSIPIRRIQIGVGPILLRRRFREVSLELRLLLLSGLVWAYPVANFRRSRWALFCLGGALGNAAVVAVVVALAMIGAVPQRADGAIAPIVFAQVLIITMTLFPYRYTVGGLPVASDGLQVLQLLWEGRDPRAEPAALYANLMSNYCNGGEGPSPTRSPAALRVICQLYRADRWTDADARRDLA